MGVILGSKLPRIYNSDINIDFNNLEAICQFKSNLQVPDQIMHKSVLTGRRTLITKGHYAKFELVVVDDPSSSLVFNTQLTDLQNNCPVGSCVYVIPETDSYQKVWCFVTEFTPYHYKDSLQIDAYKMTLESVGYYELNTILTLPDNFSFVIDETGNHIIDENGADVLGYENPNPSVTVNSGGETHATT